MFQKFHTDTLGGRYIKSLLAQTPIPMYEAVVDGDHLVAGCYYVYRKFIIKCVSSGILSVAKTEELYPSNTLYPSVYLLPGTGFRQATFYVKDYLENYDIKTHSVFRSSTNYYDSETHYHLGRYLRYIRSTTDLNLLPYYNCFNSTYLPDVELFIDEGRKISVNRVKNTTHKVVAVPILFGRTYSVFVDSSTQVIMRACIYDNTGYVDESTLYSTVAQDQYTTDLRTTLQNSGKIYSSSSFHSPLTFRVETSSTSAVMMQHNLYLVIQLALDNDSSIVVLENYTPTNGVCCDENYVRKFTTNNLSLLQMNTRNSYAFSNRLIEYLLGNVIHSDDLYSKNIEEVQTALAHKFTDYKWSFTKGRNKKGVWDKNISSLLQALLDEQDKNYVLYDQDGFINKDIESLIYLNGGKR